MRVSKAAKTTQREYAHDRGNHRRTDGKLIASLIIINSPPILLSHYYDSAVCRVARRNDARTNHLEKKREASRKAPARSHCAYALVPAP